MANAIALTPSTRSAARPRTPYRAQLNARVRPTTKAAIAEVALESGKPLAHVIDAALHFYVAGVRDGRLT